MPSSRWPPDELNRLPEDLAFLVEVPGVLVVVATVVAAVARLRGAPVLEPCPQAAVEAHGKGAASRQAQREAMVDANVPGPMAGDDLARALEATLTGVLGAGAVEVNELRRLSGGASRETWSFEAHRGEGAARRLILRRDPPGAVRADGMGLEARLFEAAARGGVPVPTVLVASDDPGLVGSPFLIMEHVDGETIPRRVLRSEELAAVRPRLGRQCGQILARLHAIDPRSVDGLEATDQLARYREVLDGMGQPHPTFELAFRWLQANRPAAGPTAIVHGDFRHGNLIIGPDGVRAVLDWELAHVGDGMEDLGWLCVKAWRFGVDPAVGGFGTYEELIEGYQDSGGRPVDRDALRWWETLGTLKWGIMCIVQATAHISGAVRSVELAAIGRRVCENEWDLLDLLML